MGPAISKHRTSGQSALSCETWSSFDWERLLETVLVLSPTWRDVARELPLCRKPFRQTLIYLFIRLSICHFIFSWKSSFFVSLSIFLDLRPTSPTLNSCFVSSALKVDLFESLFFTAFVSFRFVLSTVINFFFSNKQYFSNSTFYLLPRFTYSHACARLLCRLSIGIWRLNLLQIDNTITNKNKKMEWKKKERKKRECPSYDIYLHSVVRLQFWSSAKNHTLQSSRTREVLVVLWLTFWTVTS